VLLVERFFRVDEHEGFSKSIHAITLKWICMSYLLMLLANNVQCQSFEKEEHGVFIHAREVAHVEGLRK
jgi:hypothetical protein